MEKDFEKDLLTSLTSTNKFDLHKISSHLDDKFDVNKHKGLLVQIKSHEATKESIFMCNRLVCLDVNYIKEKSEEAKHSVFQEAGQSLLKGVERDEDNKISVSKNTDLAIAYLALFTQEVFKDGFIKETIKGMEETNGKIEEFQKMLLHITFVKIISQSIELKKINALEDSLVLTLEFNLDVFNREFRDILQLQILNRASSILPFQLVFGGYATEEQYNVITKTVTEDMYNIQNLAMDGLIDCDCPACQLERMMKEAGLDINLDRDED